MLSMSGSRKSSNLTVKVMQSSAGMLMILFAHFSTLEMLSDSIKRCPNDWRNSICRSPRIKHTSCALVDFNLAWRIDSVFWVLNSIGIQTQKENRACSAGRVEGDCKQRSVSYRIISRRTGTWRLLYCWPPWRESYVGITTTLEWLATWLVFTLSSNMWWSCCISG